MKSITIQYPRTGDATFDYDYYMASHVPLFMSFMGSVEQATVCKGDDDASFLCLTQVIVKDLAAFGATMQEHGEEILADIPNFTTVAPQISTGDVL
ncbi:MAG: EthD family reductase [Actinobacteria bacterium]|nr:EthD family reductase [Actinomycetota bacterium]